MAMTVEDWGRCGYREAWRRQKELFGNLIDSPDGEERIVLVEHDPVYTLGFHGDEANLLASEKRLQAMGAECIRIERGGDITYHGPGQLVVYPVINLLRHGLGVRKYVETLERSVIGLLESYGVTASSNNDAIGVWIDWNGVSPRKICAIGVKVSHGVTMHGLALNVNTDLSAFSLINPCGFTDKGVTSIERELGRKVDLDEVRSRMAGILLRNLDI